MTCLGILNFPFKAGLVKVRERVRDQSDSLYSGWMISTCEMYLCCWGFILSGRRRKSSPSLSINSCRALKEPDCRGSWGSSWSFCNIRYTSESSMLVRVLGLSGSCTHTHIQYPMRIQMQTLLTVTQHCSGLQAAIWLWQRKRLPRPAKVHFIMRELLHTCGRNDALQC